MSIEIGQRYLPIRAKCTPNHHWNPSCTWLKLLLVLCYFQWLHQPSGPSRLHTLFYHWLLLHYIPFFSDMTCPSVFVYKLYLWYYEPDSFIIYCMVIFYVDAIIWLLYCPLYLWHMSFSTYVLLLDKILYRGLFEQFKNTVISETHRHSGFNFHILVTSSSLISLDCIILNN